MIAGAAALLVISATLATLATSPASAADSMQYTFRFVNGQTISGTANDKTHFLPNAGGTSATNPTGMEVHLSCSDEFPGGWGEKDGPVQGVDTAWQIASYFIQKGSKTCGTPTPPPPPPDPPAIDIEKFVNGDDADDPTGPVIQLGGTATFTYVVTNTGGITVRDIEVKDSELGAIGCPQTSLEPGESMDCDSKSEVVNTPGQFTMKATVTGVGDVQTPGLPAGSPSKGDAYRFTFVNGTTIANVGKKNDFFPNAGGTSVTNPTGMKIHLSCSDEFPGGWGEKDGPVQGVDTAWQIASFSIGKVKDGVYEGKCGDPFTIITEEPVMDMDPVYFIVPPGDPEIDIEKFINGDDADTPPGPTLRDGETATFTYVVTNTGDVPLEDIAVEDNVVGVITCPRSELGVGESMECTPTTMEVDVGDHTMESCVEGFNAGREVNDCDPVYWTVPPPPTTPKIDIEKYVNGDDADNAPGPTLDVSSDATFTYVVTNTGDVPLEAIAATDNVIGALTCPRTELGVGESMECSPTTMAVEDGQNFMESCVKGFNAGREVNDCDPVYYYGDKPSSPAWIGDLVTYEHSGDGASDVQVDLFLTGADGSRARYLSSDRTDASGNYSFHPAPGCYTLVFIAPYGLEFVGGDKYLELHSCVGEGETDNSLDAVLRKI
ncbi:MAG: DUF7507 domain-containing protein [Acidimicrobiales bacterium]